MGKQKGVISINMKDEKSRSSAFKIAVRQPGVVAASIQQEKGQIEVVGEFDAVVLVSELRKKLGQAHILTLTEVVEKKVEKVVEPKKTETPQPQGLTITHPSPFYPYYCDHHYGCRCCISYEPAGCTIM
ncbi:unnamed protein product [Cuscuta europaea]|uniref:HMA domain-containing protein n=1 Tax=Cuscuta europaea TaxID=41803 RepID=A0A9P1EET0_CUSEU|nr:unnamed protein product [Cuscuta europaea]CAH9100211.1 unnamed protein product [Cuscuta europaea]